LSLQAVDKPAAATRPMAAPARNSAKQASGFDADDSDCPFLIGVKNTMSSLYDGSRIDKCLIRPSTRKRAGALPAFEEQRALIGNKITQAAAYILNTELDARRWLKQP
jgi:hypothetical protein